MAAIRIVDVTSDSAFGLVPPCADPSFDHRTCDYWEDAVAGTRVHRDSWLRPHPPETPTPGRSGGDAWNPFLEDASQRTPAFNPFATRAAPMSEPAGNEVAGSPGSPPGSSLAGSPGSWPGSPPGGSLAGSPDRDFIEAWTDNPFAPTPRRVVGPAAGAPRKLTLLTRGLEVFGSYARVLLVDDRPVAYCQFGPLSAYPRALRLRDLYPHLPSSPLPAVITCIATAAEARHRGHALELVTDVCRELGRRGFSAVETYPEAGARPDATSAASPAFWERAGFEMIVADERFPVMRREL